MYAKQMIWKGVLQLHAEHRYSLSDGVKLALIEEEFMQSGAYGERFKQMAKLLNLKVEVTQFHPATGKSAITVTEFYESCNGRLLAVIHPGNFTESLSMSRGCNLQVARSV